jgi:hypothetical protein
MTRMPHPRVVCPLLHVHARQLHQLRARVETISSCVAVPSTWRSDEAHHPLDPILAHHSSCRVR